MKILHVISTLNPSGGGPIEVVKSFICEMNLLGCESSVACLDERGSSWLGDLDFEVFSLGPKRSAYGYSSSFKKWIYLNAIKYDKIIVHGLWEYSGFCVRQAANKCGVDYYIFPHGMLGPWFKENFPLKHLKKYIYWIFAENKVLRGAKKVLFTCNDEMYNARKSFGFYKVREEVVGVGVKSKFSFNDHNCVNNKKTLLFVGRLHPVKGVDILIDAFLKFSETNDGWQLIVAGPDFSGIRKELELKIRGDKNNVIFTGAVYGEDKWKLLSEANALILPSHHENFGMVVAEALSCGTPVLISNKVNIYKDVLDFDSGIVFDDNFEGVFSGLLLWCNLDPGRKKEIRINARKCYENLYNINVVAKNLYRALSEI